MCLYAGARTTFFTMKHTLSLFFSFIFCLSLSAKTIYFNTGGQELWGKDSPAFFAHSWGAQDSDVQLSLVSGDVFKGDIPDGNTGILFVRMPGGSTAINWNTRWNQTSDLSIPADKDCYTITGWGSTDGQWSKYGSSTPGTNPGGGTTPGGQDYSTAVPEASTDIMLQAFYWDSNKGGQSGDNYGDTKWSTLLSQADEINRYFDLVWLAPSAASNDNMGYIPKQYTNQSCNHGFKATLDQLISALHAGNTKVIADIVINHCGNKSSWCDYWELDFGTYGKYQPQSTWMTKDDEGSGRCSTGQNNDDGQENNRNYGSARDWDHKNTAVQDMMKAYLKWMKSEMKYDGFRYDYCVGFHTSHVGAYNTAAKPYLSVMEYWQGDANTLRQRIDDAGKNTMTFDFALKYGGLRDGIFKQNYNNLKNAGLRGKGYQRYAVTFVDNHDTFHRSDSEDVMNKKDGSSINDKSVMMQCNAYILSMPGIPCVFYPHWVRYKSEIEQMIVARKAAGIHSESAVTEESGQGYYRATIQGKTGTVKLMLGSAANDAQPQGYQVAVKGDKYAMYYQGTGHLDVDNVSEQTQPVLDPEMPMYNILGQRVDPTYQGIVIQNGHKFLLR